MKHSLSKNSKAIKSHILHKEFEGKCKQANACEILFAGIGDNCVMRPFDTGHR